MKINFIHLILFLSRIVYYEKAAFMSLLITRENVCMNVQGETRKSFKETRSSVVIGSITMT